MACMHILSGPGLLVTMHRELRRRRLALLMGCRLVAGTEGHCLCPVSLSPGNFVAATVFPQDIMSLTINAATVYPKEILSSGTVV